MSNLEDSTIQPEVRPDDAEPMVLTKGQYRQLVDSVGRLTNLVSGLSSKMLELTHANNKIVEAVNGLPSNEMLINAVVAEVIAVSDKAEEQINSQLAKAVAQHYLSDADAVGITLEEDGNEYYRAKYDIVEQSAAGNDQCVLMVEKLDRASGEYVQMEFATEESKILGHAIQHYLISFKKAEPGESYYIRKGAQPNETPNVLSDTVNEAAFNDFMENTMKQGAVGDFSTSVDVTKEPIENGVRFKFTEANEVDETPFSFEAYEIEDGVEKAVSLDADLGMYYTSCVQSAGGKSGEFWYIQHR